MTSLDDYDALPEAMRQAPRWLLWREEPSVGDKKPRKVPYYVSGVPRHGILDSAEDQGALVTLEQAVQALSPQYAGLGFALGPDGSGNHWQGIDLDALSEHPHLQLIADELPGYTETSPSGNGRHAIGYGRGFQALGSNGSGIEAYSSGRYFTVTGEGAGLGEPVDLANFINSALRPLHSTRPTQEATVTEAVPDRTRAELRSALASMRADDRDLWVANGQRLKRLGEQGRALWIEWSQQSDKFDPVDAARVWDSLDGSSTGHAAIFAEAQRRGWLNPLSAGAAAHLQPAPAPAERPHFNLRAFTLADVHAAKGRRHPHAFMGDDHSGLFPEGEVTVIGAPGREGKTTLIMSIAREYALGRPVAGMVPTHIRSVVIYSAEDDPEQYLEKIGALCSGLSTEDQERFLANIRIPNLYDASVERWREIVTVEGRVARHAPAVDWLIEDINAQSGDACPPGLLIFETASTLSNAEEDNAGHKTMISALKRIAKATGTAAVLVHHTSQNAASNLPTLSISEADIRGGTTLVANARQTHLVVNLGSDADPFPDADARTVLRSLVAPGVDDRVVALVCLSSSKCADPVPLFFRWEVCPDFGPRMYVLMPPRELRGKRWRRLQRMLAGAKAEARADKKAEAGQANVRIAVRAAAELAAEGVQPTITKVSARCGRSPTWAKPHLAAAVELGELVRSTEAIPYTKGLVDVFRPVADRKPWEGSTVESTAANQESVY